MVSPSTAAVATGSTQSSRTVTQNIEINNQFNGDRAGQQKSSEAMDKATSDSTEELAAPFSMRGDAHAKTNIQPVSVAGIEFPAMLDETQTFTSDIPEYPWRRGSLSATTSRSSLWSFRLPSF